MPSPRFSYLSAGALLSYGAFAVTLGARIAERPFAPYQAVVSLAAISVALTIAVGARIARSVRRGPLPRRLDATRGVACSGADAALVRAAALVREDGGGRGYVRPARRLVPLALLGALLALLVSGLLNVLFHAEGEWTHWAGSARDLDARDTYDRLSLGALADPADLRYAVAVDDIRRGDAGWVVDLAVVDREGRRVGGGALGPGDHLAVGGLDVSVGPHGPGVRLTVVHEQRGRVFERPVPLLPLADGSWGRVVEGDGMELSLALPRWPPPPGAEVDPRVSLRSATAVLCEGRAQLGKVNVCGQGYGFIPWEIRPWVELRVAHRTFRAMTIDALAVAAVAAALWPLLRARPFWYREDPDGSVSLHPRSALEALRRARG